MTIASLMMALATICHKSQILISTGFLRGWKGMCVITIRDDLVNANAEFIDKEVVDGSWVGSRHPVIYMLG